METLDDDGGGAGDDDEKITVLMMNDDNLGDDDDDDDDEGQRKIAESVAMRVIVSPVVNSPVVCDEHDDSVCDSGSLMVRNLQIHHGTIDEHNPFFSTLPMMSSSMDFQQSLSLLHKDMNSVERIQQSNTLWIGNLPGGIVQKDLIALFQSFGEIVGVKILAAKHCGFVSFRDESVAHAAKTAMNGHIINGKAIRVNLARDNTSVSLSAQKSSSLQKLCASSIASVIDPIPSQSSKHHSKNAPLPSRALWIGNIGDDVSDAEFASFVAQFGRVESVRILREKRCGFVNYPNISVAQEAIKQMKGKKLGSSTIKVNFAQPPASHKRHHNATRLHTDETSDSHIQATVNIT